MATTLNPWYIGQLAPAWRITLATDGGGGKDLTGVDASALSLTIRNTSTNTDATGAGTFTIIQAAPLPVATGGVPGAIVQYQPAAADVAVAAGIYNLFVNIQYANGQDVVGPYQWTVAVK